MRRIQPQIQPSRASAISGTINFGFSLEKKSNKSSLKAQWPQAAAKNSNEIQCKRNYRANVPFIAACNK